MKLNTIYKRMEIIMPWTQKWALQPVRRCCKGSWNERV